MGVLFRLFFCFILVGCAGSTTCDAGNVTNMDWQSVSFFAGDVKQQSRNAAVEIQTFNAMGDQISGSGAYIAYKDQFYILTAAHVVGGTPYAMIENGKETIIGDVVFVDSENDVALVSIQGMVTRKPLKWRVSANNKIGSEVFYSGYPNGYTLLTIAGKVAGYDKQMTIIHSYVWRGASGSVVLDSRGRILGVVSAVDVGSDITGVPAIIEEIGLVVPVDSVSVFLQR